MLVPFLIMLREGLEAALIVGIVASYLVRSGRREWLTALWVGVGLACAASLLAGAVLSLVLGELPQRGQELFEAVIGLVAAAMLSSMVLWMRKAARSIRGELQAGVDAALGGAHQGLALVGLAFLAVAREGLESVFFLLAILQQSSGAAPIASAAAGLILAAGLGYAIYALGVKLDLRAFFRWTGVLILFVAAGLVANAVRSLHEAGLWNQLQQPVYDLGVVLPADGAAGALLSGLFGYQERAVLGEVIAYFAFLLPMLVLFLREERGDAPRPVAGPARRAGAPPLRIAALATALLVCGGLGAFVYAAAQRGPVAAGARDIAVAITERSCDPATVTIPAGPASFVISNRGERVLEWEILDGVMVLEERENIAPGQSRRLTTQLRPGTYAITCGLLSAPHGRLIVEAAADAPAQRLTLMDLVGPAAEYRAVLGGRAAALAQAIETATTASDEAGRAEALAQARSLLRLMQPAAAGDQALEARFAALAALLAAQTDAAPLQAAAQALSEALDSRTVLPDTMLAGAIAALAEPRDASAGRDDLAAATEIAQLLLPLTGRVSPDLAGRVHTDLAALAREAEPGGARAALAGDLAAMRKALAVMQTEPKS